MTASPERAGTPVPERWPRITLIAAMAHERVIGRGNRLPWHLPADLAHFKRATLGKPIVMGRRTWESLPGLLPQRRHIVLSARRGFCPAGAEVAADPDAALALAGPVPEVMVVGGASVYRAFLGRADRLLLTEIDAEIGGDTFFPAWSSEVWCERERRHRPRDLRNPHDLDFLVLERRDEASATRACGG